MSKHAREQAEEIVKAADYIENADGNTCLEDAEADNIIATLRCVAATLLQQAEQPEDSRCPTTYRREGAVKTLIGLGWKWDGQQWQAERELVDGKAVAWTCGLEPDMKGWISVKAWSEGEFTIPLYLHPPAEQPAVAVSGIQRYEPTRHSIEPYVWQLDPHPQGRWVEWEAVAPLLAGGVPAVVGEVMAELEKALLKFPTWPTDPLHAVGVFNEEAGELSKAVLQQVYEPHKNQPDDVRKEARQAAAMALRFLVSLDSYDWTPGVQHDQPSLAAAPTPDKEG